MYCMVYSSVVLGQTRSLCFPRYHQAAFRGDKKKIQEMIINGQDVDERSMALGGQTALHVTESARACSLGTVASLQFWMYEFGFTILVAHVYFSKEGLNVCLHFSSGIVGISQCITVRVVWPEPRSLCLFRSRVRATTWS